MPIQIQNQLQILYRKDSSFFLKIYTLLQCDKVVRQNAVISKQSTRIQITKEILGQILAHAFFPRFGGEIHFDDDEWWSPVKYSRTFILQQEEIKNDVDYFQI